MSQFGAFSPAFAVPSSAANGGINQQNNAAPASIAQNDHNVAQAGNDGISTLTWSPTADYFVSGNWDNGIRCWQVVPGQDGNVTAILKAQGDHWLLVYGMILHIFTNQFSFVGFSFSFSHSL